jgi:sporulation protein YlmC with PRC-barrel domain
MQQGTQMTPGAAPGQAQGNAPNTEQWVVLSTIKGLPIVDLSTGARLGDVADLILSPTFRYLEAFTSGGSAFHRGNTFPARGSTIGVHAVTLPRGAMENWDVRGLDQMPRASALIGMKLLTETGRIVGEIQEIRIDPNSGTVMAYEIHTPDHNLFDRLRRREAQLVPATAITQYGKDTVILQDAFAQQYLHDDA